MLLRVDGKFAAVMGLLARSSGPPTELRVVHEDWEETGDVLSSMEACDEVSEGGGWILG